MRYEYALFSRTTERLFSPPIIRPCPVRTITRRLAADHFWVAEGLFVRRQRQPPEADWSVRFSGVVIVQSELGGELLEGEPVA